MAALQEQKNLMLYQRALYHFHMLAIHGPSSPLGGCYEWMSLRCWTPRSVVNAVPTGGLVLVAWQKAMSNCKQCIQHECSHAKVPMHPIIGTTSFELLHVDFMSIEMTMELDLPPNVVNVLVFCNHFTKHIMVYVILNQTAETVAKFL